MILIKIYDGNKLKCGIFYDDNYINNKDKNNDINNDDGRIIMNIMIVICLFIL